MTPFAWVTLVLLTVIGLWAMDQIPLVVDAITLTGFSANEVLVGIASVLLLFYCIVAVFKVKG